MIKQTAFWGQIGQLVATRGVNELAQKNEAFAKDVNDAFIRYLVGDWGECCDEDAALNDEAAAEPGTGRTLAAYTAAGRKIWIITEADRSATTILFPSEY